MEKIGKNSRLFKEYLKKMDDILKDEYASRTFDELRAGKNSYLRVSKFESSSFDISWIKTIEDVLYDLGEIIKNPRQTTRVDSNLVPVELAKKTNSESVQHLASHSQFVKSIDEDGNVIPNKILSMSNEDEIKTYENRFIATFIRRLVLFIEKRYEVIQKYESLHNEDIMYVKNKSTVDGAEVEIETKIKVKRLASDETAVNNKKFIARIEEMRNYILYYYRSDFMKALKTEHDVRNPILQTNIIRKNPKYRHCYEVYKFIERYDKLGVSFKAEENATIFNDEEMDEINATLMTSYLAVQASESPKNYKRKIKVYKPKILTSIDDEIFTYGKYIEGPIQFVRTDEKYDEYLRSKLNKDLPEHPTKLEREYYKEEYDERREYKQDKKEVDKLVKRKLREQAEFEKEVARIIEKRKQEEEHYLELYNEVLREQQESQIDEIRKQIIRDALGDTIKVDHNKVAESIDLSAPTIEDDIEQTSEIIKNSGDLQGFEEESPVEETIETIKEDENVTSETFEETPTEESFEEVSEPINNEEIVQEEVVPEEPIEEEVTQEQEFTEEPVSEVEAEIVSENEDVVASEIIESDTKNSADLIEESELNKEEVSEKIPEETPVIKKRRKRRKITLRLGQPNSKYTRPAKSVKPVKEEKAEEVKEEPVEEVILDETPTVEEPISNEVLYEEAPVEEIPEETDEIEENSGDLQGFEENDKPKQRRKRRKITLRLGEPNSKYTRKPSEPKAKPTLDLKPKRVSAKPVEAELPPIPGRFIVKTPKGYYVEKGVYSKEKTNAYIFRDFNKAKALERVEGGKVVKL